MTLARTLHTQYFHDGEDDSDDCNDTYLSGVLTELQLVRKPGKLVCRVREVEHHEEVHPHLILLVLIMLMMMMTMTTMTISILTQKLLFTEMILSFGRTRAE